jgi:hypothetical protein
MTISLNSPFDPSRHRRYKPGSAAATFSAKVSPPPEPVAELPEDLGSPDWHSALSALEQNHRGRWAQLEERLIAAERLVSDLAGQIREMR